MGVTGDHPATWGCLLGKPGRGLGTVARHDRNYRIKGDGLELLYQVADRVVRLGGGGHQGGGLGRGDGHHHGPSLQGADLTLGIWTEAFPFNVPSLGHRCQGRSAPVAVNGQPRSQGLGNSTHTLGRGVEGRRRRRPDRPIGL